MHYVMWRSNEHEETLYLAECNDESCNCEVALMNYPDGSIKYAAWSTKGQT